MLSGARLAWLVGVGAQRIAEGMVWVFAYVFLGIAPMVQSRTLTDPATTPDIWHQFDQATFWAVAVGLTAFSVGCLAGGSQPPPRWLPRTVRSGGVTLLAGAGLAASLYFVTRVGPPMLFLSREELDWAASAVWPNSTTAAIVRACASMPLLVTFVALVRQGRDRGHPWFRRTVVPGCVLIVLLVVVNPISSPRYVFGTVALSVVAALGLLATRARFRATVLAAVGGLLLVFPLADAFRRAGYADAGFDPVGDLTTGDFDAWPQISNALMYLSQHGSTEGRQGLGVLLFWVPRSIWEGKPVDTGVLLAEFRGYSFTNLSAPLWAELLINGGWVALVVGMAAFGWVVRRWDNRTVAELADRPVPGVLACILPFYMLILLRGSLLQATATLAVILLCAWFVRGSVRVERPAVAVSADSRPIRHPARR